MLHPWDSAPGSNLLIVLLGAVLVLDVHGCVRTVAYAGDLRGPDIKRKCVEE